ncbi:chromosome partitioning protein [Actinoplanes sp. OR16]|uniref:polysaccharide biosynthesis tyrosine autokinase n=1 Tax=Actinoplanes sp. OR16 TaxID=946334 RepID=UPI000F716DB4|nr:polysaccharide biosynthesis tyrosine autokinase [Actinoplanes sp. OR16]BBH71439.1 chromosome partitioning protein [Actinoplanes sp. OR16]
MGLRDYLGVAKRHWWLLAVWVLVALAGAMVVNLRTTPVYAARVTFFFTAPMAAAAELYPASMFSSSRLATYAELLTSDEISAPLAALPEVNLTAAEMADRISSETIADTVLMEVTVEDPSRKRALFVAEKLSVMFKDAVEKLEWQETADTSAIKVEVVDGPELEPDPVEPQPLNNVALAMMGGLIVGVGSAVLREIADSTVRSADTLRTLASAPVLARIPLDGRVPARAGPFVSASDSPRTEALRQVRTLLQSAASETSLKTLAVTSAVPGEGRSATTCSLALLFAETGQRVLVVDAELRRPRLARFLGRETATGLSTVLSGGATVEQVIQPWGAGLWLLAGGQSPPNPSELLSSPRMTEVVDEVRRRFDVVIFDCPPLLPVTDGEVLAARADGTVLVVRYAKTTGAEVTGAVRALNGVNATLLGCVLNMVPLKGPDAFPSFDQYTGAPPARRGGRRRARFWSHEAVAVAA